MGREGMGRDGTARGIEIETDVGRGIDGIGSEGMVGAAAAASTRGTETGRLGTGTDTGKDTVGTAPSVIVHQYR